LNIELSAKQTNSDCGTSKVRRTHRDSRLHDLPTTEGNVDTNNMARSDQREEGAGWSEVVVELHHVINQSDKSVGRPGHAQIGWPMSGEIGIAGNPSHK